MNELTWSAFGVFVISTLILYAKEIVSNRQAMKAKLAFEARQKAQIVAELFALWYQTVPDSHSFKALSQDEYKRLNQLSYECSFWLPEGILNDLTLRLTNADEAKDIKDILVEVREHLGQARVDWQQIVHW